MRRSGCRMCIIALKLAEGRRAPMFEVSGSRSLCSTIRAVGIGPKVATEFWPDSHWS